MRRHLSPKVGIAVLVILATALAVVPHAAALCGDCLTVLDQPECVSPPETYAFCRYYWEVKLYVVYGKIVRVRVLKCEGYQDCAA